MKITEIEKRENLFNKQVAEVFEQYIKTDSVYGKAFDTAVDIFTEVIEELREREDAHRYDQYDPQVEYVESMLEGYFRNKVQLYKLLGGVTTTKQLDLQKNSDDYYDELRHSIDNEIDEIKHSNSDSQTIKKDVEALCYLQSLLGYNTKEIMNNQLISEKVKLSKHLASVYGGDNIATTLYSNSIQSNTIKSKLVISISPLDYVTMSENAHGWQSCHRLNGAYSQGIQSYMRDESTIVAFMASYKENFPWNSKKWRQVVYVAMNSTRDGFNQTGIIPSRHYPNDIEDAEDAVTRVMLERFNNLSGSNGKYIKKPDDRSAVYSDGDYGHYLDLSSTDFTFYRYENKDLEGNIIPNIKEVYRIGAEGICLNTGETLFREDQRYLCSTDRY